MWNTPRSLLFYDNKFGQSFTPVSEVNNTSAYDAVLTGQETSVAALTEQRLGSTGIGGLSEPSKLSFTVLDMKPTYSSVLVNRPVPSTECPSSLGLKCDDVMCQNRAASNVPLSYISRPDPWTGTQTTTVATTGPIVSSRVARSTRPILKDSQPDQFPGHCSEIDRVQNITGNVVTAAEKLDLPIADQDVEGASVLRLCALMESHAQTALQKGMQSGNAGNESRRHTSTSLYPLSHQLGPVARQNEPLAYHNTPVTYQNVQPTGFNPDKERNAYHYSLQPTLFPSATQQSSRRQGVKDYTPGQVNPTTAEHCHFCKNNGERRSFYSSHKLQEYGRVTCPILQRYVCPLCGATGESAHTISYCPLGKGMTTVAAIKTQRKSCGCKRTNKHCELNHHH